MATEVMGQRKGGDERVMVGEGGRIAPFLNLVVHKSCTREDIYNRRMMQDNMSVQAMMPV